jgi:hypothetical protein
MAPSKTASRDISGAQQEKYLAINLKAAALASILRADVSRMMKVDVSEMMAWHQV